MELDTDGGEASDHADGYKVMLERGLTRYTLISYNTQLILYCYIRLQHPASPNITLLCTSFAVLCAMEQVSDYL